MAWSLFWDFSGPLRSVFSSLWGSSISTDSPSSGMDGLGELPKRLSIKLEICLVIRALYRALGWHLASQTTQTDNHEHSGARWEKAEATVYLDPNISQTFIKAYRDAIEAWNQTGAFTQAGHK